MHIGRGSSTFLATSLSRANLILRRFSPRSVSSVIWNSYWAPTGLGSNRFVAATAPILYDILFVWEKRRGMIWMKLIDRSYRSFNCCSEFVWGWKGIDEILLKSSNNNNLICVRREIIVYRKIECSKERFSVYNECLIEVYFYYTECIFIVCEINRGKDCLSSVNTERLIIWILKGEILNYSECLIGLSACCSCVYVNWTDLTNDWFAMVKLY